MSQTIGITRTTASSQLPPPAAGKLICFILERTKLWCCVNDNNLSALRHKIDIVCKIRDNRKIELETLHHEGIKFRDTANVNARLSFKLQSTNDAELRYNTAKLKVVFLNDFSYIIVNDIMAFVVNPKIKQIKISRAEKNEVGLSSGMTCIDPSLAIRRTNFVSMRH